MIASRNSTTVVAAARTSSGVRSAAQVACSRRRPRAARPATPHQQPWGPALARPALRPTAAVGPATADVAVTGGPRDGVQQQQQQQEEAGAAAQSEPPLAVIVRPASGLLELRQVARLRAEAYHADDRSRFAESFKRQFAAQEVESLQHRTVPRNGRAPQCDCLVAVEASSSSSSSSGAAAVVVGCIDIRVPQAATGAPASGVPAGEPTGAYLLNVVVDAGARGRGVGRALMRAAMGRAAGVWGATRLFTHVDVGNDVAEALYRGCGFTEHSESAAYDGASTLGRRVLLVAEVSDAAAAARAGAASSGSGSGSGSGDGGGGSGGGSGSGVDGEASPAA